MSRALVTSPYTRALSAAERTWLIADRLCPPFAINLILEGEGRLDVADWRAAVAVAANANPGVRLRLKGALGWSKWVDSREAPPVTDVHAPDWDGQSSQGAGFLARPMDLRNGASTDVWLVNGTVPRVVIRCHHAITDGSGILRFASEIGRALRGEPLSGSPSAVTDLELTGSLGKKADFPPEDALAPTGRHRGSGRAIVWRRRSVSRLRRRFLSHAAAFVGEATRRNASIEGSVRVDIPVDLRRHDPDIRSTANLVGMLKLEVPAGAEPAELDAALQAQIEQGRYADSLVSAQALRWIPLWLGTRFATGRSAECNRESRYGASAVLSSLGKVDSAAFSGPNFQVRRHCMMPPAGHATPLFVLFSGHNDGVEIMASMPEPLASDGRFDALMDGLADAISA